MAAITTITGGGAFTRQNITDLNNNFTAVGGRTPDLWVRPQNGGVDTNPGTFDKPLATMAGTSQYITPGIVIAIQGVLTEEFTGPIVNDVTLVGYNSGAPRQATTSGAANGGGATWLSPTSGTGILLKVQGQGWTVDNIFFNNSATANPCVQVLTTGDPPASADGSHFTLQNCILTGTDDGFQASGGTNFVNLLNNTFFGFSGSGDTAVSNTAGAGIGTLCWWNVIGNTFLGNAHHFVVPTSGATIAYNRFSYIFNGTTSTSILNTGGGKDNSVHNNYFDIPYSSTNVTLFPTFGTNDRWYYNEFSTAVSTTIYSFGQPTDT